MRDFLRGTLGTLLQATLLLLGLALLVGGCVAGAFTGSLWYASGQFIGGILCLCAAAGIKYWLGSIIRPRR